MAENSSMSLWGDRAWSTVGKLAVLVALILGVANLYGVFRPEKTNLVAHCVAVDLPERPPMQDLDKGSKNNEGHYPDRSRLRRIDTWDSLFGRKGNFLRCDIMNSGKKEAKEVFLDVPFQPRAVQVQGTWIPQSKIADASVGLIFGSVGQRSRDVFAVLG